MMTMGRRSWFALSTLALGKVSGIVPPVVVLGGGKSRLIKGGNPLVFSGAVGKVQGAPGAGDVVDVHDGAGGLIGWGVYNPFSQYRVRILAHAGSSSAAASTAAADLGHRDLGTLVAARLRAAALRRRVCGLPSETDTAYRLCNSEGDRLSGLTVDVFNHVAVVVSSAFWLEREREAVTAALLGLDGISEVVWRRADARLKMDGWPLEGAAADGTEGDEGDGATQVVLESGLRYEVSPSLGQKSGFFCDQRENRAAVGSLSRGLRVLDLFCYSGGFGLSAAHHGAAETLGVDSSAAALDLAKRNAELNGQTERMSFLHGDCLKFLQTGELLERDATGERRIAAGGAPRDYDVVICDPPKYAPSVKDLQRATRKYRQLNGLAMRALKPGGLLVTCTCSAAMTQSGSFLKTLQEAAEAEGRTLTLLSDSGAARDHMLHPAVMESKYLTCLLLVVD